MNNEITFLLQRLKGADSALFPAADTIDLTELVRRARNELGFDPPPDYMEFLRGSDGAAAEGVLLYGARSHVVDGVDLPGVIETNLERRAYRGDLEGVILVGEFDDDFIAFDRQKGGYCRIDRASGDRHHPTDDLGRMVADLLSFEA